MLSEHNEQSHIQFDVNMSVCKIVHATSGVKGHHICDILETSGKEKVSLASPSS